MREVSSIEDVNIALRELYEFYDYFKRVSVDLHGKRFTNVGKHVDDTDFVRWDELTDRIGGITEITKKAAAGAFIKPATFGVGLGSPVVVQNDATPPWIWSNTRNGTPNTVFISSNTPPEGADIIIDLQRYRYSTLTSTSIFGTTLLHLPAGANARRVYSYNNIFATSPVTFQRGDVMRCHVTQIGTSVAGQDIAIVVWFNQ